MGNPFENLSDTDMKLIGMMLIIGMLVVYIVLPLLAITGVGYVIYLALIGAGVL